MANPPKGRKVRLRISEYPFGFIATYEELDIANKHVTALMGGGDSHAEAIVMLVERLAGEDY